MIAAQVVLLSDWHLAPELNKPAAYQLQLGGSVLIWHMTDWLSAACCLYGIWGAFKM
jgi:hypothetical protein